MNAYWEPLDFELPPPDGDRAWRRWIDTSLDSPNDIVPWQDAPVFAGASYRAGAALGRRALGTVVDRPYIGEAARRPNPRGMSARHP